MSAERSPGPSGGDGPDLWARLFVAVVPPPAVLDRLERWLADLRSRLAAGTGREGPGDDGLRWTTRPQWHITLRFLGQAPLATTVEALAAAAALPPVAEAELGPHPQPLGRGVICLPVRGLELLTEAVATATEGIGRPPQRHPFGGHLTLARTRSGRRPPLAEPFIERFDVGEIQLMRSTLRPSGAVYDVVGRRRLEGLQPPS